MKTKNGTKSAAKTPAKSKGRASRPSASASTSAATPPPLPVDASAARQFKALSASVDNSLARLSDSLKASAGRIADTFTRAGECATESLRLSLSPAIRPARDAALSRFRQLQEDTRLSLSPAISSPLSPVAPPARELPTHYLSPEEQRGILNAASPGLGDLAFPFPAGSARAFLYDDLIRRTLFFCEARPICVFRVAGAGDLRRDDFRWFYEGVKTAVEEWARKMEGKPREAIAADAGRVVEQSRPALEKTLVKAKLQRGELTPGGILLHFESWMRAALEAVQGSIRGGGVCADAASVGGGNRRRERETSGRRPKRRFEVTQDVVAVRLGVDTRTVSNWERGETEGPEGYSKETRRTMAGFILWADNHERNKEAADNLARVAARQRVDPGARMNGRRFANAYAEDPGQ